MQVLHVAAIAQKIDQMPKVACNGPRMSSLNATDSIKHFSQCLK